MIREHGETAAIETAMRADAMLDKGDMDGKSVWLSLLRAVRELQNMETVGSVH